MAKDFCEYCNATLPVVEKLVTVYRHRRGKYFIFEGVPARVCQKCGERYFSAKSVSEMQRERTIFLRKNNRDFWKENKNTPFYK